MRYDLKQPCDNCPFLKVGGIRLHPERVREIAGSMLSDAGSTFACHKTVHHDEDGEYVRRATESQCAGALIFAEKNANATQAMRAMERIGIYDRRLLEPHWALIFGSLKEMLQCNKREQGAALAKHAKATD